MNSKTKPNETITLESELMLDSHQSLNNVQVHYKTYGKLNKKKDNAILVCHALTADAHAASSKENGVTHKGWWDKVIGPNKAIDTKTHFVICSNVLGSCYGSTGPASINPSTNKKYLLKFPVITIRDMVRAQKALIDSLGIDKLKLVIGPSMGGFQALEWAINFPDQLKAFSIIASASCLSPQGLAFNAVSRKAITTDPKWKDGNYASDVLPQSGLGMARMIGHITYLSKESIAQKFGRKLQKKEDYGYNFNTDFQIESYLDHQGDKFVKRFDPNCYLYLVKAMSYFDLAKEYGSLEKALKKTTAKSLVLSINSDWLYPTYQSKEIVKTLMKLNKEVTYAELDSPYGHDSFLLENNQMNELITNYIKQIK